MEEVVKDINDDKNEIYDEGKEAECLDETSPDDIEEGVNDRNDNNEEKEAYETKYYDSNTICEGRGVNDERGVKDVDVD